MRTNFNPHLHKIEISPIVTISELAKAIAPEYEEKSGRPFIYFQRGEIDLPVFPEVRDETIKALQEGKTKYPISGGTKDLREALVQKLQEYNKITGLSADNVVLTYGGQEALQMAFELFRGGRGAGFTPIWTVVLESFVPYSGIHFTEIPLREDFSIDFVSLEKLLASGLDFFYLNNPHNPTGKVFTSEELLKIGELCQKNKVFVISDEAYEYIVFDDKKHISLASLPELTGFKDIVTIPSFSKTYSMTGFRAGYAATKNGIASDLLKKAQYTQTAGVVSFIQPALKAALKLKDQIQERVAEFQKRRDLLYDGLKRIDNLEVHRPEGAIYVFPNFARLFPASQKSNRSYIYERLLQNGICVVPGQSFAGTDLFNTFARLSFSATPLELIKEAVERMEEIFSDKLGRTEERLAQRAL